MLHIKMLQTWGFISGLEWEGTYERGRLPEAKGGIAVQLSVSTNAKKLSSGPFDEVIEAPETVGNMETSGTGFAAS